MKGECGCKWRVWPKLREAGAHRQLERLVFEATNDSVDVNFGDVGTVNRQRTPRVADNKCGILGLDVYLELWTREKTVVRLAFDRSITLRTYAGIFKSHRIVYGE